jgi:hypothetical protein
MTTSYTVSEAITFTVTHAKHLAAKVATDLKRIQRLYGSPSDGDIANYEGELILLVREGYLSTVTYGFRRNGAWIEPTLSYSSRDVGSGASDDDDPGRVRPGAEISNATFYSYLTYSSAWEQLSVTARDAFKRQLPIQRAGAPEPAVNGYLSSDRTYSAAGRALARSSVRGSQ